MVPGCLGGWAGASILRSCALRVLPRERFPQFSAPSDGVVQLVTRLGQFLVCSGDTLLGAGDRIRVPFLSLRVCTLQPFGFADRSRGHGSITTVSTPAF